jgi:polyisoprenoid-binding protein YceI
MSWIASPRRRFTRMTQLMTEQGMVRVPASIDTGSPDRDEHLKGPVTMDASVEGAGEDLWGTERVGIRVRGKLDRKDFGRTWQQPLAKGGVLVGEEVKILIDVSAVRAS